MPPSKRKPAQAPPPSPFKRLKAKVGKKAPKPANYTATDFKSAALHLQNQDRGGSSLIQNNESSSQVLTSGRGRSVTELQNQMHHPSVAVRVAAIKGIQDIVTAAAASRQQGFLIASHLSVLLSAIGKAAVEEEEDEVRKMGLNAFQKLLGLWQQDGDCVFSIKPFLPLILAYLKSALNSLDRDTRRSGVTFVQTLAAACIETAQSSGTTLLSTSIVAPILPALVRIWDDKAFQAGSNAAAKDEADVKKQKRKQKKKDKRQQKLSTNTATSSIMLKVNNGRYPLLDCLHTLLRASAAAELNTATTATSEAGLRPTMVYTAGGRSKNGLVLLSSSDQQQLQRPAVRRLDTLEDMPPLPRDEEEDEDYGGATTSLESDDSSDVLLLENATSLLSKLRDTLVELQQNSCMETFHLVVKVLDLLWQIFGTSITRQQQQKQKNAGGGGKKKGKDCNSVIQQIRTLLLESFPYKLDATGIGGATGSSLLADAVTAQLCLTLVRMAHYTELSDATLQQRNVKLKQAPHWFQPVVEYICTKLTDDKSLKRPGNEASHEALLMVLHTLLKRENGLRDAVVAKVPKLEKKLVQAFIANVVVIPQEEEAKVMAGVPRRAARAKAGLISADICTTIIANANHDLAVSMERFGSTEIGYLVVALPDFLVAWETEHLQASALLMQLLNRLFRSMKPTQEHDKDEQIARILATLKLKLEGMVDADAIESGTQTLSIFEVYPPHMQRLLINLLTVLEAPTPTTLTRMAELCAKSNLIAGDNGGIASSECAFLIHSVYYIRKTIPMQQFLGFLVDSTGATRPLDDSAAMSRGRVVRFDEALREVSQCLVFCGVERIAPMLRSLFLALLKVDPACSSESQLFQRRFVFATLAMFALDAKTTLPSGAPSVLPDMLLSSSAVQVISDAVLDTFQGLDTESQDMGFLVVAPIAALLFTEPKLLLEVLHFLFKQLLILKETSQSNVMHWISHLLQDKRLDRMSVGFIQQLRELVKEIEGVGSVQLERFSARVIVALDVSGGS